MNDEPRIEGSEAELIAVPMDEDDRERLSLLMRGETDTMFLHSLAVRYDLAKSIAAAKKARPERVARVFACNPDETLRN